MPYFVNLQKIEFLLQAILKFKYNKNVYCLKSREVGKQNSLIVGTERIISSEQVKRILKNEVEGVLKTPDYLIERFLIINELNPFKEQLAKPYLLASTFCNYINLIKNKHN